MKVNIYMTDVEVYLQRGSIFSFAGLPADDSSVPDSWVKVGEGEVDLDAVSRQEFAEKAAAVIDEQIGKLARCIAQLEARKAKLLALPAPEDV